MAIFVASKWIFVKKAIAGLIIILLLAPAVLPSRAYAGIASGSTVFDPLAELSTLITSFFTSSTSVGTWKDLFLEIGKNLLKVIAKKALKKITESTVNWANQGFEGKPLFLQNPDSFFTDIEHDEIKETVNEIGGDPVNFPWGRGIAINKVREARGKSKSTTKERIGVFDLDTRFDLNSPEEIEQFYSDTRIGGWDGWTAMINNPNNNPIGFDLAVSNDLNKQTDQKTENWEKSIQGMFLPTQECADPSGTTRKIEDDARNSGDMERYERERCKQWKDTTPSSLVADKISSALTSGDRQSELSAALGSSLSQIFSTLLNTLIDKGLSALSTNTIADTFSDDTWSFGGENFSTGPNDLTSTPSSWADETKVINLDEFKKEVQDDIKNVNERINLTQQIVDIMETFPKKTMELDQCLPGPDMRWEMRFIKELKNSSKKLEKKAEKKDGEKGQEAINALSNLETAAEAFVNYVKNFMLEGIENSVPIVDWLKAFGDKQRKLEDYKKRIITDREKLARLNSIKNSLDALTPDPNTEELDDSEKEILFKQKSQHIVTKSKLPQDEDVAEAGVELEIAKDWNNNFITLTQTCDDNRVKKGLPSYKTFDFTNSKSSISGWAYGSEREMSCNWPIENGDTKMNDRYIYPNQTPVNDNDVWSTTFGSDFDISIDCNDFYYSYLSDYSHPDE